MNTDQSDYEALLAEDRVVKMADEFMQGALFGLLLNAKREEDDEEGGEGTLQETQIQEAAASAWDLASKAVAALEKRRYG